MCQTQLSDDSRYISVLLRDGLGKFQTGRECQRLCNSEMREQYVVLHDVGCVSGEVVLIDWDVVVKNDSTRESSLVDKHYAIRENIQ